MTFIIEIFIVDCVGVIVLSSINDIDMATTFICRSA